MNVIKLNAVEEKIITIRDTQVIMDSDVAELYGVETREVNQAIKNNPNKFPQGYVIQLNKNEWLNLKSKILTSKGEDSLKSKNLILNKQGRGQHSKYLPNVFTEKGLYMLATILKGERATDTTIDIIEAFARLRELTRTVAKMTEATEDVKKKTLMQQGGEIMAELLGDDLKTTDTETCLELNFAVFKVKHTVRRKSEN